VVDSGCEVDLWWLERVICWKMDRKEEDTALERTVTRAHDCCLPVKLQMFVSQLVFEYPSLTPTEQAELGWLHRIRTRSSPIGPAEHDEGGSLPRSVSSLLIRFNAIVEGGGFGRYWRGL
jgi:hypothetical protein